jgi:glutathione synthase
MRHAGTEFNPANTDMQRILFLVADAGRAHNDNHERLPAAFRAAGWSVDVQAHESVRFASGEVLAGNDNVRGYDRVWVLGLGRADTFFDRMQLLRRLPQSRFVTRIDALMYLHAKYAWSEHMPETHADNDAVRLAAIVARGGDWIAKPTAGSFGRDVLRVGADAPGRAALEHLTSDGRYCLLQRFVPEIAQGEKRTLVAGSTIIGTYLRLPGTDFRTNLSLYGRPAASALTDRERELVNRMIHELVAAGVGFAAIDSAGDYLMEVNLANPGGLATLASVYGRDFAPAVVSALSPG